MTGLYVAPWDINVGASLTGRQGYAAALREAVTGLNTGTINVVLDPIGDIRFDNVYELDLRFAKDFHLPKGVGFTVSGDVFNAPNKRTVLQRETLVLQNANGGAGGSRSAGWRITELQAPRVWVWVASSPSKPPSSVERTARRSFSGGPFLFYSVTESLLGCAACSRTADSTNGSYATKALNPTPRQERSDSA
ncbi:MAG TPA: hypothetical protein VGQ65_12840 [Thermoanaerobaculia bacterium]|nr:hypothetical protein [Thermoanaerobaculia bacterium]